MFRNQRKAFVSWSGGKDSALAYYNAMKNNGMEIAYLLNMLSENGTHSRSHGLTTQVLKSQGEAMKVPMIQMKATWQQYEEKFKKVLAAFKREGVSAGIFGDIDVQEHRDWVERVCSETGIKPLLPLWYKTRESLMEEFISAGFKAVVVAVNLEFLGSEWLGRQLDRQFIEDMKRLPQVDLCGENGEYHTFVYDGPIFKKSVEFIVGKQIFKEKRCFLALELKDEVKKV